MMMRAGNLFSFPRRQIMKSRSFLFAGASIAALALSLAACETLRGDDDENEVSLELADLPAPVREAVLARTSEDNITQLTSEVEGGQTVYEVEYTVDGMETEAEFDASGNLLEEGDDADDEDDDDGEMDD
jgi:hypothetical protein